MKRCSFKSFLILFAITFVFAQSAVAQIEPRNQAPVFSLEDTDGVLHDLSLMKKQILLILFFFDLNTGTGQETLIRLYDLIDEFNDNDIRIWGVTRATGLVLGDFLARNKNRGPILIDKSSVAELYQAQQILPTVYFIGQELTIIDAFQGDTMINKMLIRLAERQIQRDKLDAAYTLCDIVLQNEPKNLDATLAKAYVLLFKKRSDQAEKIFYDLSQGENDRSLLGKEGLSCLYQEKGLWENSMLLANEVIEKDPERSFAYTCRGNAMFFFGQKKQANQEYINGYYKSDGTIYQKDICYNMYGRYLLSQGDYLNAREIFEKGMGINPYSSVIMNNIGMTYEREGKWQKAIEIYRKSLILNENDMITAVMANNAQEMAVFDNDTAQKNAIEKKLDQWVGLYNSHVLKYDKQASSWTSQPLLIGLVNVQEQGVLVQRDGIPDFILRQLIMHLQSSGRIKIIKPFVIESFLKKVNLMPSDLNDIDKLIRIGNIMNMSFIGLTTVNHISSGTNLSLKLIPIYAPDQTQIISALFNVETSLKNEITIFNQNIRKNLIGSYPLRGHIAAINGDKIIIDIGSKNGVMIGTYFNVFSEKGSLLKPTGTIEVISVSADTSTANIIKQKTPIKVKHLIEEKR